ncbi:hypothetical protein ACU5P1_09355 [Pseudomonas plecoglossicida]|uniref:Flagellar protein FliT n=1 Tax=Pseudomonas plecoglossicida TaxID=70775 RepID=A0AAD0VVR9_PSEDL|nr:hypothetical protein [Pseudomonas plecoglossicida]AXM98878.1 hypothetical protein DVB73_25300 [Pseudomonas plecoglossicida]EPB95247.1 hypothetical protein L321_13531 [Pseudomonas plecoglossicida NB2011]QLB55024.1 hypothetical protein HAV28_09295 [Pseudomonas plecoglossicida]GLR35367.1 hypothetical protein GCM10011247_07640 [Pseudomonas plecoglossicida]
MLPENDRNRLALLQSRLGQLWLARDWAAIGELDGVIRLELQQLQGRGAIAGEVVSQLALFRQRYTQVLEAGRVESERLRSVLNRHIEHSEGRTAYFLAGSDQGVA